ncbi:L,D-transpeptidase [Mesorhizobium sp. KR2-14]|uniref:L,D-transpeptidase n=1 Tax=Mesorhizobium sp. KR2-14 TaxID=3156610 RepID=UPI0032B3F487
MNDLSRRGVMLGSLAFLAAGCTPLGTQTSVMATNTQFVVDPRYKRTRVKYDGNQPVGTIVVNTSERFLYAIEDGGWAMRYGVGIGEEGRTVKGKAIIGRKANWPAWTPTVSMMQRKPRLLKYAGGVPGGPNNPLGARALYLYRDGKDTMLRLHGTNEPWTIGTAVSSGCIRLTNEDIIDLYERTNVGTEVLVL